MENEMEKFNVTTVRLLLIGLIWRYGALGKCITSQWIKAGLEYRLSDTIKYLTSIAFIKLELKIKEFQIQCKIGIGESIYNRPYIS